ncbi:MAG: DUF5050 domain-containing protein [Clostridiales bacterium]|jgi:hypothetical protein|nr:DUF5050 domain-containing protein [Clostridiales bacterium]
MNLTIVLKRIAIHSILTTISLSVSGCPASSAINMNGKNTVNPISISDEGSGKLPAEIENANYLGNDGDTQYYCVLEEDNCVMYALDKNASASNPMQIAVFPPAENGGISPALKSIVDFGICGDWIIISAGSYEGSAGYFSGDFARMKKDGSALEHFWLTDDNKFVIVDDLIYYNFWTVKGSADEGCYRIRPDGTDKEYLGDMLSSIFCYNRDGYLYGEHDTGETINKMNPMTDLIRCKPDERGFTTLFSADRLPRFDSSDYMLYNDIEIRDNFVLFTVYVHGYREGDSWRGHYNYIADFCVDKDGGNLTLLREEYPLGK